MNVQDVVTRVRRVFGDEAAVQLENDDIIRWINDAQIEIVKKNDGALQKTGLVDLVADQSQYTMPADLFIIRSLRYKFPDMESFRAIKFKNMQEFDDSLDGWDGTTYSTGAPMYFTVFENIVQLFPVPNQSMVQGLKVLYNQKPTDVSSLSDALALPLIYHNTVWKYCMWQASLLDEDHEPALMYKSHFDEDMSDLRTRETQQATETYASITTLADDQW